MFIRQERGALLSSSSALHLLFVHKVGDHDVMVIDFIDYDFIFSSLQVFYKSDLHNDDRIGSSKLVDGLTIMTFLTSFFMTPMLRMTKSSRGVSWILMSGGWMSAFRDRHFGIGG